MSAPTITITSEAYRAGQRACRETLSKNCPPNWRLVKLLGQQFLIGFQEEWEDLTLHGRLSEEDDRVAALATRRYEEES